jgi:hypothetical protein
MAEGLGEACVIALALVPMISSCQVAPAATPSPPTVAQQPGRAPAGTSGQLASSAPLSQTELASAWLDALRRRDAPALTAHSRYPFELRDTRAEGNCDERRTAANAEQLPALSACLVHDDLLAQLLNDEPATPVEALPAGYTPGWANQWKPELTSDVTPFSAYLQRDDASVSLILLVANDGVRAVWKNGFDARPEVNLATRWLAALRQGNVTALIQLTSFPFELRDRDLHANCGKRTARNASEMTRTLDCLLADEVFKAAILEESPVKAGLSRDFEPEMFQGWRHGDQVDLWPALVLVGDEVGNEFDLTLLVGKSGVRALWKRGSFSPAFD